MIFIFLRFALGFAALSVALGASSSAGAQPIDATPKVPPSGMEVGDGKPTQQPAPNETGTKKPSQPAPTTGANDDNQKQPPPIKIARIDESPLSLGTRVEVTLSPEGARDRLRGDGSKPIVVSFDGRAMPGIQVFDTPDNETLAFELVRTAHDQAAWSPILALENHRKAILSLQGPKAATTPYVVEFNVFERWLAILGACFFGFGFFVALVWAGLRTTMLRDAGSSLQNPVGYKDFGTFSLGRVQMAIWFFLVVMSFMLIWAATGDTPSITNSVLALIGIGSGTALGAAVIDDSKRVAGSAAAMQKANLEAQAFAESDAAKKLLLQQQAAALQASTSSAPGPRRSISLPDDLLTDANGWSFHRLQLVVWTSVLGAMFCASVIRHLVMPDFDGTQLALLGISSGTYLGFKLPERQV